MDLASIIMALLVFALLGFLCYLIVTYIPMPEPFKQVIIVVLVILIILYLLGMVTGQVSLPRLSR
jgi:heme A synthase